MEYKLSKYGVAYDLANTPYVVEVMGYVFSFSSAPNMRKFMEGYQKRIDWLNDSLSRRFHVSVSADELALIQWYGMSEGRGFRVLAPDGEWFDCQESMIFRGTLTSGKGSTAL